VGDRVEQGEVVVERGVAEHHLAQIGLQALPLRASAPGQHVTDVLGDVADLERHHATILHALCMGR